MLTDENSNTVAQYTYDAWGNIISSTGSIKDANPYRYAGYRYDEGTGLYYLMARYYDAGVGRFITRDTFYGFEDNPISQNQYVYTNNNPVKNTDPTGHGPTSIVIRSGVSAAAAGVLLPRGYTLAYNLFFHALWGYGFSENLLISKLKSSPEVQSRVKSYISQAKGATSFLHLSVPYEFKSGDLYYALQHVTFNFFGQREGSRWKVGIRVIDRYDFTQWRKLNSFASAANNLGNLLQDTNLLTPYNINVRLGSILIINFLLERKCRMVFKI
ncbi:RHS repeat-associated core domain-containing protein [Aneurinibacillus tyrosinisolvens]|uniref:RHS repeat-associated core domain-containing protein n=1 Tax=Aneurinibacillus tyrosinisolvens TaxID=1443435 RepID=UPI00069BF20D|nr:RHS repeat-associated core domain-containing protein [Aneurinibacillus tyrosinisolvens]